jgi:hypothetical protein
MLWETFWKSAKSIGGEIEMSKLDISTWHNVNRTHFAQNNIRGGYLDTSEKLNGTALEKHANTDQGWLKKS